MDISKNNGTPKSSILIRFSIINHPFWGFSPYFWKHSYKIGLGKMGGLIHTDDQSVKKNRDIG